MFLSSLQPTLSNFDFSCQHGISCDREAVEMELSYLADFDRRNMSVETRDDQILLEGVVKNAAEVERVIRVAREIVGYDRVISRLIANSAN
ncbi:BON domain-containing protein [Neorhizobium alkalisoli]|uniref:BON domain-containing protein n=1 Tax=Neorhizobium alkalisoli TaxID=528178 RepID=A0A561QAW2_9HYPH|nr:BON domain-containing protein [Neorhizobium alkalisoli]TWF47508.1 BON domain-containing protein [Neorhizobium alkalisoli]